MFRRWRELGEKPILWTKLKLKFNVYKKEQNEEGEEDEDEEVDEEDEEDKQVYKKIRGWTDELALVLTMGRLHSLEHLTLDFSSMDRILWQDCMQFIQYVQYFAPSVKQLSWGECTATVTPNPTPVFFLAQELVEKLVKFKEVHFSSSSSTLSSFSFDEDVCRHLFFREHPPRFGNGINSAILRALPAALDKDGSELKVLTLHCRGFYNPADLTEAQKKLTVNIISREPMI